MRGDIVLLQDLLLKIRVSLAVNNELLDEVGDGRIILTEGLDDLGGLRFDGAMSRRSQGRLPVKKHGDRAADDDQREQQNEHLATERGDLIRNFRRRLKFVHGLEKILMRGGFGLNGRHQSGELWTGRFGIVGTHIRRELLCLHQAVIGDGRLHAQ